MLSLDCCSLGLRTLCHISQADPDSPLPLLEPILPVLLLVLHSAQLDCVSVLHRVRLSSERQPLGDHDLGHLLQLGDEEHVLGQEADGVGAADGGAQVAVKHLKGKYGFRKP